MLSERESAEETTLAAEERISATGMDDSGAPEDDPEWAGLLGYLLNARGFEAGLIGAPDPKADEDGGPGELRCLSEPPRISSH